MLLLKKKVKMPIAISSQHIIRIAHNIASFKCLMVSTKMQWRATQKSCANINLLRILSYSIFAALISQPESYALPFSPDPISFAGYLNATRNWYDRSLTIRFENLGNCDYAYMLGFEYYGCKVGYAKIKDGISDRKCRVNVHYDGSTKQIGYNEYDCRKLSYEEKGKKIYEELKSWWLNK